MKKKAKIFEVGDRVRYASDFLRNTYLHVGDIPFLKGTIKEIEALGEHQLCVIEWDNCKISSQYHDDGFGRVISPNLEKTTK